MLMPNTKFFDIKQFKVNVQGADTEWYLSVYPNGETTDDVNHDKVVDRRTACGTGGQH